MDRRSFFRTMIGGVAAVAAVKTFPFRVFSFPTEVIPVYAPTAIQLEALSHLTTIYYDKRTLELLKKNLIFEDWHGMSIDMMNSGKINFFQYDLRAPQGLYAD